MTLFRLSSAFSSTTLSSATLCALAVGCTLLPLGGCAPRGDVAYPDTTVESRNRADAIRADAVRRKAAIEKERDDHILTERFQATQRREKARQERETIILARDQQTQPLTANINGSKQQAEHDQQAVTDDAAIRTRGLDGAAATAVTSEADAKRAEIARKAAADQAALTRKIDDAEAAAREQQAKIDKREADEATETQKRIDGFTRDARDQELKVDQETSAALTDLGNDSAKRVKEAQTVAADQLATDRAIASDVRASLDRDRANFGTTTVVVKDGVVQLGGEVPNEDARKKALALASDTKHVVKVEDHMATVAK